MDHERLDLLGVSPPLVQAFVGPVGPALVPLVRQVMDVLALVWAFGGED